MPRPAPSPSETDDSDSLDGWERALLDRQLEALGRLADMGMAMAEAIHRRATAEDVGPDADLNHAAMDFARVSRAVRMTFALQSRLVSEFKGASGPHGAEDHNGPIEVLWRNDIVDRDEVKKRQLRGIVETLAEGAALDREGVERLVREAGERLEDDDAYHDLTRRPLGESVALICKDLGLQPDWNLLADIYWAREEIAHSPPGSPYAGWKERSRAARPLPLAGEVDRPPPGSG